MLRALAKLLRALNAEGNPAQISLGFTFGMMVGLMPLWSLFNLFFLFVVLIFRINLTAFLLAFGFFSGVAYIFDPLLNQVGEALLTAPSLQGLWIELYQNDFWRLAHFNNTLTMGALVTGVILAIPFFFLSNILIKKYREKVMVWVRKTRLMQFIKSTRFYDIYTKLSGAAAP